jgi:hypothetical protein
MIESQIKNTLTRILLKDKNSLPKNILFIMLENSVDKFILFIKLENSVDKFYNNKTISK